MNTAHKYEIDCICFPGYQFESEIAMLTGLKFDEIYALTSKMTRWNGQDHVELFQQLGYNCNNRFIKFDRQTPYPCLMRTNKPKEKRYWYGFVYYDDHIYLPTQKLTWAEWNEAWPNYRVTSMLQVWI